jgi:peptidyl-dipeptidase A
VSFARSPLLVLAASLALTSCGGDEDTPTTEGQAPAAAAFIASFNEKVVPAWQIWRASEWEAHTHVRTNDARFAEQAQTDRQAYLDALADPTWLQTARDVLREAERLLAAQEAKTATAAAEPAGEDDAPPPLPDITPAQVAAVDAIRTLAREVSQPTAETRAALDRKFTTVLRFRERASYKLDGTNVPREELAASYRESTSDEERRQRWIALLAPSADLKPGYAELRDLHNTIASKGGWENHLALSLHDYGMKQQDLELLLHEAEVALRPLFRELHTWTRHALAAQYGAEVPEDVPIHWLDDPLGTTWAGVVRLPDLDVTAGLELRGPDIMVRDAETWFTDVGLAPLPVSFWEKSSLYPSPPGERFGKTGGASTWEIDMSGDIRTLMSVVPTEGWMHATHRELAIAHAMHARSQAKLPAPIRMRPPRALQAALATWADLGASRTARLRKLGILDAAKTPSDQELLLQEALHWVAYVPFAAGTAYEFERLVYGESLPVDRMNTRWWELARQHQGVVPPETRAERWGDALSNPRLVDAPGHYVDHALAALIAFQVHVTLCERLGLDPRTADLSGHLEVGEAFTRIAEAEGVVDFRKAVQDVTGEPLSAEPMMRYFAPLLEWLVEQNDGRLHTLPKL